MKPEIIKHEVEDGNYLIVKADDSVDAEIFAQEFLDALEDNDKYKYSASSTTDLEDSTFRVHYNVYNRK